MLRNLIALILALIVYSSIGVSWDVLHIWVCVFLLQILASLDFKLFGRKRIL